LFGKPINETAHIMAIITQGEGGKVTLHFKRLEEVNHGGGGGSGNWHSTFHGRRKAITRQNQSKTINNQGGITAKNFSDTISHCQSNNWSAKRHIGQKI
jgi:hypothetical protein